MSILLFEHNLKALNAVKIAWETSNKTCIIHATGTGKSLIISKNIEENPNAKHFFLSPSTFIFEEIKKHLTKAVSKKVLFQSYAYLLDKERLEEEFLNLDFIYLDEFHRVGATKWGNAVQNVLTANPKAKVLGTSATPIRYLDDSRNMAEELFDNNIASELPLGEAILQGIHKKPKYVTTLYNYSDILSKTRNKIQKSNLDDIKKNQELERLRSVEINWNSSKGIDTILKKHLNVERKKILVFCRDSEHREESLKLIKPIFDKIYKSKIKYYSVGSDLSDKSNFEIISSFRKEVEITSVLFSINMLNEGLHINGTDTCIFFRDTESPIVYFQQLGRVFHTNQLEQPLVIDLINNFKLSYGGNIFAKKAFESFGNTTFSAVTDLSMIIDFFDEVKDFNEVINSFKTDSWEINYERLKTFYNENNRLPKLREDLGQFVRNNKENFKFNNLSDERILKLKEIDVSFFDLRSNIFSWDYMFNQYVLFFEENNYLPTPTSNSKLATWAVTQRSYNKKGKLKEIYYLKLINKFPNFFNTYNSFEDNLEEFREFYVLHKKAPSIKENKKIYNWLVNKKGAADYEKILAIMPELEDNVHHSLEWHIEHNENFDTRFWRKQLLDYKRGRMAETRVEILKKLVPAFFKIAKLVKLRNYISVEEKIKVLYDYCLENKRIPLFTEKLYNDYKVVKKLYLEGDLNKNDVQIILDLDENFFQDIYYSNWKNYFKEYKILLKNKNYHKDDVPIYTIWAKNQKVKYQYQQDDPKAKLLIKLVPNFFVDVRLFRWMKKFEEFKVFYEKNKKLPTSIEFEWFIKQRKFYFMNSLAPYKIKLLLSVDKNCLNKKLESIV